MVLGYKIMWINDVEGDLPDVILNKTFLDMTGDQIAAFKRLWDKYGVVIVSQDHLRSEKKKEVLTLFNHKNENDDLEAFFKKVSSRTQVSRKVIRELWEATFNKKFPQNLVDELKHIWEESFKDSTFEVFREYVVNFDTLTNEQRQEFPNWAKQLETLHAEWTAQPADAQMDDQEGEEQSII